MDRERLDDWCEKGVLGLVIAILAWSALALGCTRPQDFLVVQWMTVALLIVWTVRFFINPKHRLLWVPICWPALAFVIYAVVRYFTADLEYVARQELTRVLVYAVIFFATINNLHKQEPSQIVGLTLISLATLISFFAVIQFLSNSDKAWTIVGLVEKGDGFRKRGSGSFFSPNHLAGYLEMVLPLALAFTLTGRFSHLMKVVLGYCSVVIFVGQVVTFSRAGWLAAGVSLVVLFYWMIRQRDYWKRTLIVMVVFAALFAVTLTKARLSAERTERFEKARQIEDVRFRLWEPAKDMWRDHLWFGVGPGHFDYRFAAYRPYDRELQMRPDRVHNDYLNTVVDWGLVGGLLVAACWLAFYGQVFHGWRFVQRTQNDLGAKRSNRLSFVLGGALGLLAILVHSYWDYNMHVPANAVLAVTLLGLSSSYYRFASERYWHTVRWPLRLTLIPALLAVLVGLSFLTWRRTGECIQIVRVASVHKAISQARKKESEAEKVSSPDRLAKLDAARIRLAELGRNQIAAMEGLVVAEDRNFEAAADLGEALRIQSFEGLPGWEALAEKALVWFRRAIELNPYDARARVGYGMCLDRLGRPKEAEPYFETAVRLDPNHFSIPARVGWHYFQVQNYATAKRWFEKSMYLFYDLRLNSNAWIYLKLAEQKLAESTNSLVSPKP